MEQFYMILIILFANIIIFTAAKSSDSVGEYGPYFEGDMDLTDEQIKAISGPIEDRHALKDITKHWPNGIVVYYIEESHFDKKQIGVIKAAMTHIEKVSCIRFRQRRSGEYATRIAKDKSGCSSSVGYIKNMPLRNNNVNLGLGCFRLGTVVHELLHTLGLFHMHSTHNRDDYVTIVWDNIKKKNIMNFKLQPATKVSNLDEEYDYGSVMHYSANAFAINKNKQTIIPKKENVTIGQRQGLSPIDIRKINKMYCGKKQDTENVGFINANYDFFNVLGFILCIFSYLY